MSVSVHERDRPFRPSVRPRPSVFPAATPPVTPLLSAPSVRLSPSPPPPPPPQLSSLTQLPCQADLEYQADRTAEEADQARVERRAAKIMTRLIQAHSSRWPPLA